MAFIYETSPQKMNTPFDPYRCNGARQFEKHFGNLMYLQFIAQNPRSSFVEKRQAETEMVIARRKMKYWNSIASSQGLDSDVTSAIANVKRQWQGKDPL
jgi:hypothetical protein